MAGRILVVDDSKTNRLLLTKKLHAGYYQYLEAANGLEAIAIAKRELPDIILLDVIMPGMSGFKVCKHLKKTAETSHIPIVMITSLDGPEERIKGLQHGADDFISKPISNLALFSRLRNLMHLKMMSDELRMRAHEARAIGIDGFEIERRRTSQIGSIWITGSCARKGETLTKALATRLDHSFKFKSVAYVERRLAERTHVDCIICDGTSPWKTDALRIVAQLRAQYRTRHLPIIVIVPKGDQNMASKALDLGANDYIIEGSSVEEFVARIQTQICHKFMADQLRSSFKTNLELVIKDPLTGLFNRRFAISKLQHVVARHAQDSQSFAVILLDLDHFKQVNDTYGHEAGDQVLVEFAKRAQMNVRETDFLARYGGEEFVIVLPNTTLEQASQVADRVSSAVAAELFEIENGQQIRVTISAGVACGGQHTPRASDILRLADHALYRAKNAGRNQVMLQNDAA